MSLYSEAEILAVENRIKELTELAIKHDLNLSKDIAELNRKLKVMEKEIYQNLRPWEKLKIARRSDRPTSLDYIERIFDGFIEFHGDRRFADDASIVGGVAFFEGRAVTVIGHQKGRNTKENIQRNFGMPHPEGYRKALRLMEQADKFKRPIICFIDTPGAYCGLGAEERGQGEAIAKNLMEMMGFRVPVIAIVIGEGGSGGALALGVGNKVHMLEHAVYSVLSPEGFASILWKDSARAEEASEIMKITAKDIKSFGFIDEIIPEPIGGAHKNIDEVAKNIKRCIKNDLNEFVNKSIECIKAERYQKFRTMGAYEIMEVKACTQE